MARNQLAVFAPDLITVGQYFFEQMVKNLDELPCKPEDRYKYTNPGMLVNYLQSLPLKPSEYPEAFQLSETGCKVLDVVAGHDQTHVDKKEQLDPQSCVYAIHQSWGRIQLKYKPSRMGANKEPVFTQVVLAELWAGGEITYHQTFLAHGRKDPSDPASPLRPVEAGEYCDILRSATDGRLGLIVQHGNFDGIYPTKASAEEGKVAPKAINYLMASLNEAVTKYTAASKLDPAQFADAEPAVQHFGQILYRLLGIMRTDKIHELAANATPAGN